MIVLPWVAFLLGIAWMVRQGNKAKREYLAGRERGEKGTQANQREKP